MTFSRLGLVTAAAAAAFAMTSQPALAFGPERFDADTIEVENLLGTVEIQVDERADGITAQATGKDKDLLDRVTIRQRDNRLIIDMDIPNRGARGGMKVDTDETPVVALTVPPGTDLRVNDIIGVIEAKGTLDEVDIRLESAASMEFEDVRTMLVDADGALNLEVGDVTDGFELDLDGAGNVEIGRITGRTRIDVEGMSNVEVARVDGPLAMTLDGLGRIHVRDGNSDRLDIDLNGLGSITYDGESKERRVNKSGLGSVTIRGGY